MAKRGSDFTFIPSQRNKKDCHTMVLYNYAIGKMKKKPTYWDVNNGAIKKRFNSMWKVMYIGIYMYSRDRNIKKWENLN